MRFMILGGDHVEGNRVFHKGEVFSSDRPLDLIFTNKFERMPDLPAPAVPKAVPVEVKAAPVEEVAEEDAVSVSLGKIVTDRFPQAADIAMVVYRQGKRFNLAWEDEPNKALNDELLTKEETEAMIAEYVK